MKILVTGSKGQLGYDVVQYLSRKKINLIGIDIDQLDLTNKEKVFQFFEKNEDITHIIHCAAYTAVDNAEDNEKLAYLVNYNATKYLVDVCKKKDIEFMYISTDYVYKDEETDIPHIETDDLLPLSVYGKSKFKGEQEVINNLKKYYIARISWVFGMNGNNFVKSMLKLSETNKKLNIVSDQIGSPTYTYDLAPLLIDILVSKKYGIYNVSNEGFCSWYEFAKKIFSLKNISIEVLPIKTEEYITKAKRPKNSRMSKEKLIKYDFKKLRNWENALEHYLNNLNINKEKK